MEYLNSDLARQVWEKKYRHNNETLDDWFVRVSGGDKYIENLMRQKKFIFGGRILSNRRTERGSLSNCYTLGRVEDSLDKIMEANTKIALTFKSQGGQGISLSDIRPKGAKVGKDYHSDGIVPFMEIFNTTTENISQGGSRRGALILSLDASHPEIETFITIKSDLHKINNANLSVEINDPFMKAVKTYYDTGEKIVFTKKSNYGSEVFEYSYCPIDIFKKIAKQAYNTAEPGILFMNKLKDYNLMQFVDEYNIQSTNPCGEQPLIPGGACLLSAINVSEYVLNPWTDNVCFDYKSLSEDIEHIYKAMNDTLDEGLEYHALPEQKEAASLWRNIGIGTAGWADLFIKFMTPYGSTKSIELIDDIGRFMFEECLKCNIKLGEKDGNFPKFNKNINYQLTDIAIENKIQFPINNMRNCSMLTIAPTGSIALILGVSGGIEPEFALSYTRKTKSLDGKDTEYTVYPDIIQQYLKLHPEDTIDSLPYYFVMAYDIEPAQRVLIQATLQKHIDSAISSTVNLPSTATIEDIEQLYLAAWENGCKGITVYVDGSRDPILSTNKKEEQIIFDSGVIKRPKEVNAHLYLTKINKEVFSVIVGTINDKPYEVFAFKVTDRNDIKESDGKIIKVKKGLFKYVTDDFVIEDLNAYYGNIEERATTLYISMLLRHNASIPFIVKTAKKVNPVISSFTAALCRVLNKYTNDVQITESCPECGQPLVKHGGCKECMNCGYSVCNLMLKK